jgi:hypothetical protein
MPTPLEADLILKAPFASAKFASSTLYRTSSKFSGGIYISQPSYGMSGSAVVAIDVAEGHPDNDDEVRAAADPKAPATPYVSKVSILERMPPAVEHAYLSLVEMGTSILSTHSLTFVSREAIAKASRVLLATKARPLLEFDPSTVHHLAPLDDKDACDAVRQNEDLGGPCDDYNGDVYFDLEHLVAGVRLYRLAQDYIVEDDQPEWDAVFEHFLLVGIECNITPENVLDLATPRIPRVYSHHRNAEYTNELVTGLRATLMYYARTAVAFTPIKDYFFYPMDESVTDGPLALHVVSTRHDTYAHDTIHHITSERPPTDESLDALRSILAQLLLTLEAAQEHLRFVHYDLHSSNVMLSHVTPDTSECEEGPDVVWQYSRPGNRGEFIIPSRDAHGYAVRIIDFGASRCDDVRRVGDDTSASYIVTHNRAPDHNFDKSVDARSYAHDLVAYSLSRWWSALAARPPNTTRLGQFLDVLEAMAGVQWWHGWADGTPWGTGQPRKHGIDHLANFADYIKLLATNALSEKAVLDMRAEEFIMRRSSQEMSLTPGQILDMPFFASYSNVVTEEGTKVVHVADAKVSPAMVIAEARAERSASPLMGNSALHGDSVAGSDGDWSEREQLPGSNRKKRRHGD